MQSKQNILDELKIFKTIKENRITVDHIIFVLFCGLFFSLPLGTSPPAICGALGISLWIFSGRFYKKRDTYFNQTWFWPVMALILITWAGVIYTPDFDLGLEYALKTHYWLLSFALASISFSICSSEVLIKSFLAGLFLNTVAAAAQLFGYLSAGLESTGPVSSIKIFYYKNKFVGISGYTTLPLLLVLGILMASYYFGKMNDLKGKVLIAFLMATFLFHLAILESRGGYLVFILFTPWICANLIKFKKRNLLKIALASLLMAPLIFASPIVRKESGKLVKSIKYYSSSNSQYAWGRRYAGQQDRFHMWNGALHIFLDHPIFGVGTGGYLKTMKDREVPEWPTGLIYHPHNNFLHMAASNGVIGLVALIWFFGVILKNGWVWRREPTGFFILAGGLVMLIGGMTDTRILNAGSLTLLSLIAGLQGSLEANDDGFDTHCKS